MTYAFSKPAVTFCVALALCSEPAFSAVIYDESVNGDLPELASATPTLTLGIGLNTVLGSQFLDTIGPSTSGDFDSFRFLVPTGARLISIGFTSTITGTVGGPVGSLYIDTFFDRFNNPGYSLIANEKINVLDPANPISGSLVAGLPVDAGTYLLFQGQFVGDAEKRADWSYVWTLEVAPVPLPASGLLFAGGLGLIGALSRFRRAGRY